MGLTLIEKLIDEAVIKKPKDDIYSYLYNLDIVSEIEEEERANVVFAALLKLQQRADVDVKKDSDSPYAQQLFNEHNVAICYFN